MASSSLPKIAFIGLGAMGGGMARNLAAHSFHITGYDVYTPLVDALVAHGGHAASSPSAACADADFLIFMVVNAAQVDAALFDNSTGALPALRHGATIIVTSTCPPAYLTGLSQKLASQQPDVRLLDCPVSGGSVRAANGTLSIFSSGKEEDLHGARVVLEAMAEPLYRIPGGIGMGSVAKMCHQHQAAVNIILASEVMGLAAAAELNSREVFEAVSASQARSFMFENRVAHMLANDYKTVYSAVSIILKDVLIVTEHAKAAGFPLILANMAQQLYIKGGNDGFMKDDDAGLVRMYLPAAKHDLIGDLATNGTSSSTTENAISTNDIVNIMAGVELASSLECLKFAKHVGLDLKLLSDIVIRGAGSSGGFEAVVAPMLKRGTINTSSFSSHEVAAAKHIRTSFQDALKKAEALGQPTPIATAAMQALYFDALG